MKKVENPHCPFCTNVDPFWSEFMESYQSISKKTLNLSKNEVMYGVLNDWSSCSTLNHLIIIGKYFLYSNALSGSPAKSGPLDFGTKNSFPSFFVSEKALTHRYI